MLISAPGLRHNVAAGLGGLVRKYYLYGRSLRALLRRHPGRAVKMYVPVQGRVVRKVAGYLLRQPGWGVMALLLRTVKYAAAGTGWAVSLVVRRPAGR